MNLRKNRLSEDSKRLLDHIKAHGPQTLVQMRPLTGEQGGNLIKRLRNLRIGGWLEIVEGTSEQRWDICKAAVPLFEKGLTRKRSDKGAPKPMGEMPLPRQVDVMNTTYKPEPFTPPRAGSMTSQSIASRGLRC